MQDRDKLLKQIDKLKKELKIDYHWERYLTETNLTILLKALEEKKKGHDIDFKNIKWS